MCVGVVNGQRANIILPAPTKKILLLRWRCEGRHPVNAVACTSVWPPEAKGDARWDPNEIVH
jgi:hypothetical protein